MLMFSNRWYEIFHDSLILNFYYISFLKILQV